MLNLQQDIRSAFRILGSLRNSAPPLRPPSLLRNRMGRLRFRQCKITNQKLQMENSPLTFRVSLSYLLANRAGLLCGVKELPPNGIRQKSRAVTGLICLFFLLTGVSAMAQTNPKAQSLPLDTLQGLESKSVKPEVAEYLSRKAVRVTTGPMPAGTVPLLVVKDSDFQDGTIEVDVAAKGLPPRPGARAPGFIGIAFRVQGEPEQYEYFYIRPGNSRADDQLVRNHTVQYAAAPGFDWPTSRRQWPGVYETYVDLDPGGWIKIKIEVAGRSARLFLNGAPRPCLTVDDLRLSARRGAVALWYGPITEAWFSNLRITPAAPAPIKTASDVTGVWNLSMSTDMGPIAGELNLKRESSRVTGTYSGPLGLARAVTGTWADGFVELRFPAIWPDDKGETETVIAGWFDGDTARGRVRIAGRTEGTWSARPKSTGN